MCRRARAAPLVLAPSPRRQSPARRLTESRFGSGMHAAPRSCCGSIGAFSAGRLDPRSKDGPDGVDKASREVTISASSSSRPGAQGIEQVLPGMCQSLEPVVAEKTAGSLDGVDRTINLRQQLGIAGPCFELDQVPVELVQVLSALFEEGLDDLVVFVHDRRLAAATRSRMTPASGRPRRCSPAIARQRPCLQAGKAPRRAGKARRARSAGTCRPRPRAPRRAAPAPRPSGASRPLPGSCCGRSRPRR